MGRGSVPPEEREESGQVSEVSFDLRLSVLRLFTLRFETIRGLVEGARWQLFVQHLTDGR
jgi:hypothetical protein